ncbi:ABC-2 family transporter protein [Candidatus Daviesbacteria bacterium]|nr:ABC-2 family transporter protein [Candidatus Daviesbacteria bacterium]
MKHYLTTFFSLFSVSIKSYLEHRWNALGSLINSSVSLLLMILFIEIIFSRTPEIKEWNKYEVLMLVGVYRIIAALFSTFFLSSINRMTSYIHRGDLDLFLIKPVNSQFLLSLRHIKPFELLNTLPGLVLVVYALNYLHLVNGFIDSWLLLMGLIPGLVILYSLYYLLATLTIWLKRFSALSELYYVIREPLSIPIDIFGGGVSFALTFVIPMAFVITIPVKVFLEKSPTYFILVGIIIAFLFLYLSDQFWNFALKHYTSASS